MEINAASSYEIRAEMRFTSDRPNARKHTDLILRVVENLKGKDMRIRACSIQISLTLEAYTSR